MTYTGKETTVHLWSDVQLSLVRARMVERESEAARARLAAWSNRSREGAGLRGGISRALIRAGQAIAPEPAMGHAHHGRMAMRRS